MKTNQNKEVKLKFGMTGTILCLAIAMGILVNAPGNARGAEKYPTKSVDIIVPFAAGAATDYLTRFLADELSKRWKQPANVINKTGGNTVVGVHAMMSAAPDGYTVFADSIGSSSSQVGMKGLPYDVMKRTFLAMAVAVPQTIIVSKDSPWNNLQEVADAGRKDPASIVWGAAAGGKGGSDLVQLQFFEAAGIDIPKARRVDFPGSAPAINAIAGGHINFTAASPAAVAPAVTSGKARALGVTIPRRTLILPDCPTTREAGYPTVDYVYWVGFSGPSGIPADIREIFIKTVEEILKDPGFSDRLAKRFDGVPMFRGQEAFKAFVIEEANKIDKLQKLMTGQ